MKEEFDTYTHHTFLYKNAPWLILLPLGLFISLFFLDSLPNSLQLAIPFLFFVSLVFFLVIMYNTRMTFDSIYIKDGNMILENNSIVLDDKRFELKDLKSIEIITNGYKEKARGGKGVLSDGTANRILVTIDSEKSITCKFVIKTIKQEEFLQYIMKSWRNDGFKILSTGIDLV